MSMLPTPREHAGPNPFRLAPDSGAVYRQLRLLEEVGRRPTRRRVEKPKDAGPDLIAERAEAVLAAARERFTDARAQKALESLVAGEAFNGLRSGIQRAFLNSLQKPAALAAAQRFVEPLAAADRRTQSVMLEAFEAAAPRGAILDVVVHTAISPLFASFEPEEKRRALRFVGGPQASRFSWKGHQTLLDNWWLRVARDLKQVWQPNVEMAMKTWRAFVHQPRVPVVFMKSEAFPGVVLVVVGSPDDPQALAYARIFFLDAQERLQVGLKCPVEPIRGGWSPKVDPKGVAYEFKRTALSLDEALGFVRWIEDNHSVSGPGGLHQPALSQRAVYDGLIQFDLRAPRIIKTLCAHRGEVEWTEGVMIRGKVANPQQKQAA
ncbi:MAG: hypothetical protein AAFN74_21180 [Myxococcota bacterium]